MSYTNKILFFTDKISYSGASKIITWLVNKLDIPNSDITLATYVDIIDGRDVNKDVNRVRLTVNEKNKFYRSMSVINELRKLVKKEKYNLCVGFLPTECLYLRIATIGCRVPVVVCERSDPFMENGIIAKIGRFFYRFASGAVFQTEGAKCYFPESLQNKSVVIPNPVFNKNMDYIPYKDREDKIVHTGRLYVRQKRQDILLKAFCEVCKRNETVQLIIYGDGPDENELKKLAVELGIVQRVIFAGNVANVERYISRCKMFVFSSDYEGIPNSIIEALQVGLPVVSTDCSPGGAAELINNGENGYLVPREGVEEMADCILHLLTNKSEAESISQNALKISEKYDEVRILEEWKKYLLYYLEGRKYE